MAIEDESNYNEREMKILKNMGLVVSCVMRMNNNLYDEDLFQEGCLGLINAVDRFDPERGVEFSTYATSQINSYIRHYKRRNVFVKPKRQKNNYTYAQRVSLCPSSPDGQDVEAIAIDNVSVERFLNNLSSRDREIVKLRMQGLTQKNISEITHVKQQNVCIILKRAGSRYLETQINIKL